MIVGNVYTTLAYVVYERVRARIVWQRSAGGPAVS